MSTPLTWSLGLAGLALLTFGCIALHAPTIEADLGARTSTALAGVAGASPRVDGRDVTLVGAVATDAEREQALAAATTVRGVRLVRDGLTLAAPAAPEAFAGLFALTSGPDGLVVRGRVPDEAARASVLSHLGAAFAGRAVTDRMTLDPAAEDWQDVLQALLPVIGEVEAPGVTVVGAEAVLRGTVASAEAKARLEATVLPEPFTLRSDLAVDAASGMAAAPTAAADQLTASGDAALAGAERSLGEALASGRIAFDSGTARLTAESRAVLDRAAVVFARVPAVAADIKGHTDAEGDARGNRILSIRRAEATRDYLVQKGVDTSRLAPHGAGETEPVADNTTEDGRARNRRVVFTLRQN